ncbi:MAG: YgiT-type zinc finger protein [Candidatus Latescibacteria bacterium]|nr:YgiT-type zinc finger protein [Candidatus Latescibacterota bacterium]
MICEFCGGQTERRRVKKSHWLHGRLYLLENVEAEVCRDCGERYFHAEALDTIDAILQIEHPVERRLDVEVVRV